MFRLRDGTIALHGAMHNKGDGLSGDWSKYSTAEESRMRRKEPSKNGVIRLQVGSVRKLPGQTVEHRPILSNQSHSVILGAKDEEVRLKLSRLAIWEIDLP